jgi:hypothetical protein
MAADPTSRLQIAGAVALLVASLGFFAARCAWSPAIPFVVQDAQAPWIAFAAPPTGLMGLAPRDALPVTRFERRFEAPPQAVPTAALRVRALRAFELRLNGELASVPTSPRHWREYRHVDLAGRLRPGLNTLRVDVTNATGPALLSLRLEGLAEPLVSDAGWTAAVDDGAPAAAIRVGTDRVNPSTYSMPSPGEGLAARRNPVLLFVFLSALAFLALRGEAARPWRSRLSRALPLLVVLLWTGVFARTALEIPIETGFDAHHHVKYVEFLREHRALPRATDGWSMFHPPVYYAPTALLVELGEGALPGPLSRLGWKFMGLAGGLASALLCRALARRIFGSDARETLFASLFAALLPMNVYVSAYVTNESLHAALAAGVVLATASLLLASRPRPAGIALWGLLVALAVLTKYTAWIVAGVAGFFLVAAWLRVEGARPSSVAGRLALAGGVVLALAGWFYLRNVADFGQPFPLNVDLPGETQQWWSPPGYYTPRFLLGFGAVLGHPFLAGYHTAWDSFYSTLWGDGQLAGQVLAALRHPHWDWELMAVGYWWALPATGLIAWGVVRGLCLALRHPDGAVRALHSFLLTLAYALLLSVLYMTLRQQDYGQAKAFYGLAVMAPLTIFFGLGCGAADRWIEARAPLWARTLFFGWLGSLALVLLFSYAG